jgi:hypothetical protein
MRFFLETVAGIVGGLVAWLVVGFVAGQVLTAIHGNREGAAAMGGFFVIGPLGGVAGFALSFWLARRVLERGTAGASSSVFGPMTLSLLVVVGLGWAAVSIATVVFRPKAWVGLESGQKGGLEFRVRVPEKLLGGRPVSDLVSLQFKKMEEGGDSVTPVAWTETRSGGEVTLTGRVDIERRPREQYFAIRQGRESFDIYASIPPDMQSKGSWQDEIYLGSDPATPMGDRVSITCRYVPPARW